MSKYESRPLHRPVRPRVVAGLLGRIARLLAVLGLAPVVVALLQGAWIFASASAAVVALFVGLAWSTRAWRGFGDVRGNEAFVVAALAFLIGALAWSLPIASTGTRFEDAFFESVSGITTTGLSTIEARAWHPSHLFLRSWLQWMGGIGIVVLYLALFPGGRQAVRKMSRAEGGISGGEGDGVRSLVRRLLLVYATLTLVGFIVLLAFGVEPFASLLYTLSAVSTGGFAPHGASIAGVDSVAARFWILFESTLGALPFVVILGVARGRSRRLLDPQAVALVSCGALVALILGLRMRMATDASWPEVLQNAPILAFSAQSTTGFTSLDLSRMDALSKLVITLSMAVGGSAGSTAGGLKLMTLLTLLAVLRARLREVSLPPHAVLAPHVGGDRIDEEQIRGAALHLLLLVGAVAAMCTIFLAYGHDPLDSLFEVVSAASTVGLSSGVVGPDLALPLKMVLCAGMLLGRLEFLAFLVLFAPGTWMRRRHA